MYLHCVYNNVTAIADQRKYCSGLTLFWRLAANILQHYIIIKTNLKLTNLSLNVLFTTNVFSHHSW